MKKQFKITKSINNNISFSTDEKGNEIVIFGRGIAFGKKPGDIVDAGLVQKTFELKDSQQKNIFTEMVESIPEVYIDITNQIVNMYEHDFNCQLNSMIYIGLSDHIYNAVQNYQIGIITPNEMLNEIRRIYSQEFALALEALEVIERETGVMLKEEEAGYIVLHYINALAKYPRNDAAKRMEFINAIIEIVEHHFQIPLDGSSMYYSRFVTHLDFFYSRIIRGEKKNESPDMFIYTVTKGRFPEIETCVAEIGQYISENYKKRISTEEKGYLIIHVYNLLRTKKK